ncbi:MAG TPA: hypothetical protein G4N96_12215 [Chloroflexi bacterium]|nr:MAG: hypothetical protein B6I38_11850 [Anaerolineaceae bacterium 4572_5.1]HEY85862.1 hypothetical protein [Chloroflexota bacterium]
MNSKWIRMIGIATVVAVVGVMIVSAVAFAQGPVNGTSTDQYSNFVDLDGDGVCDTCGNVPGSGQMMRGQRQKGAMDSNFVDLDGDGVCDTCGNVPGSGQMMRGQGQQGAMGSNFVDADGDGTCDNYGAMSQGQRGGQGHSGQGRSK